MTTTDPTGVLMVDILLDNHLTDQAILSLITLIRDHPSLAIQTVQVERITNHLLHHLQEKMDQIAHPRVAQGGTESVFLTTASTLSACGR